jgi:hypothetical protein
MKYTLFYNEFNTCNITRLSFDKYKVMCQYVLDLIVLKQGDKIFTLSLYNNFDNHNCLLDTYIFKRLPKGLDFLIKKHKFDEIELFEWNSWKDAYEHARSIREENLTYTINEHTYTIKRR